MQEQAKRPRGRPSAKDDILDAAEAVVVDKGAVHLTLDAVTERAGISKGGLRYHFDSKEALLMALVERQVKRYEADLAPARPPNSAHRRGRQPARISGGIEREPVRCGRRLGRADGGGGQ